MTCLQSTGETVEPATDGYFEFGCKLHDGSNEIKVVASDDAGNQTEYSIAITQSKRVKSVDPVVIATIVALIAGAILLFVKKSCHWLTKTDEIRKQNGFVHT